MSARFTRASNQMLIHCFIRDVFIPLCKAHGFTPVIYEDNVYNRVTLAVHINERYAGGQTSWHHLSKALPYGRLRIGAAADLNTAGSNYLERRFMVAYIFPQIARWGLAAHYEGGNHTHMDVGGDDRYGDGAPTPNGTRFGYPDFNALGNPIRVDANWSGNTTRKLTKAFGWAAVPDYNSAVVRGLQWRLGIKVDGGHGPGTAAALARRVGTRTPIYPGTTSNGVYAMQMWLLWNVRPPLKNWKV